MTSLKPCPFCGGGAVVSADMMPYPQVSCDACGATCGQAKATGTEAAEKAWNSRITDMELVAQARDDALEEAAKVAEHYAHTEAHGGTIAAFIRALKGKP